MTNPTDRRMTHTERLMATLGRLPTVGEIINDIRREMGEEVTIEEETYAELTPVEVTTSKPGNRKENVLILPPIKATTLVRVGQAAARRREEEQEAERAERKREADEKKKSKKAKKRKGRFVCTGFNKAGVACGNDARNETEPPRCGRHLMTPDEEAEYLEKRRAEGQAAIDAADGLITKPEDEGIIKGELVEPGSLMRGCGRDFMVASNGEVTLIPDSEDLDGALVDNVPPMISPYGMIWECAYDEFT